MSSPELAAPKLISMAIPVKLNGHSGGKSERHSGMNPSTIGA
jgi:hypothetical protein